MIGSKILKFKVIESTNNFLKINQNSLEHGTIVQSNTQTHGRGRNNHTWMSENGNLYFSILLKEGINRFLIFDNLVKTSVAIIRLLREFNIKGRIKYPNDILVEDKKICGILTESYGSLDIQYLVIGIGININQQDFKSLRNKATSFKIENNKEYLLEEVLDKFINHYNKLESEDYELVFKEYITSSMVVGKKILLDSKQFLIKGIHKNGNLILEHESSIEYRTPNEISFDQLY